MVGGIGSSSTGTTPAPGRVKVGEIGVLPDSP